MDARDRWKLFFQKCLQQRVRAGQFDTLALKLRIRSPLNCSWISEILLSPTADGAAGAGVDPLVPVYVERLLKLGIIDVPSVLRALHYGSRDVRLMLQQQKIAAGAIANGQYQAGLKSAMANPPELEDTVLNLLVRSFASGDRPQTQLEARKIWAVVSRWMARMMASSATEAVVQAVTGTDPQVQAQSVMVREALGLFLVTLLENAKMVGVLTVAIKRDIRKEFQQSLTLFIPLLAHNPTIATRLDLLQKQHDLIEKPKKNAQQDKEMDAAAIVLQLDSTVDLTPVNTRAAVYIFLNSLLIARPLADDTMIINWLHMRYKVDLQSLSIDLITASFDILANSMLSKESKDSQNLAKYFLVHKVPVLLSVLSTSMFPPLTPALCIGQAMAYVDANVFPTFSQGFGLPETTSDAEARQQFIFACILHGLFPRESVEGMLGEPPMEPIPAFGGRLIKDDLVNQCQSNIGKAEALIKQLEKWDGNAGAIVGAIVELIRNLCVTKETMSLKSICNAISQNQRYLDAFLLFTSPASIMQPLAQLLDSWRYDDDQGEYQPVFDEFAAILLLVLEFAYRYDLTYQDMAISHDSFIAQMLKRCSRAQLPSDLSEEQTKYLEGWLKAVFDSDGAGLSDEVLSICRPQEFYLLVPTIFQQACMACSEGILSMDAMKTGLEYFHETFLLPALIPAIFWVADYAWREESRKDLNAIMQMLLKLARPSSIYRDAQAMHSTIMAITSRRLRNCLMRLHGRDQVKQDIQQILEAIKTHREFLRTPYSEINELRAWSAVPGFETAIRTTFQSLVMWASTLSLTTVPASTIPTQYTHRQIFNAVKFLGAGKVLRAILDEVKAQTEQANGHFATDIAAAIIASPMIENSPVNVDWITSPVPAPARRNPRLNLRDMLKVEREIAPDLFSKDLALAETIVRVHRRVEAQLAPPAMALPDLNVPMDNLLRNLDITNVPENAVTDAAIEQALGLDGTGDMAGLDLAGVTGSGLDVMQGIDGIGLGVDTGDPLGVLPDGDDDVFAGLDFEGGMELDFE